MADTQAESTTRPEAPGEQQVPETGPKSTRERILEVALDLFTEQGYDQTSLREIAERLGFSKAALYYHFASKEQIFMALHQRLHALGIGIEPLEDDTVSIASLTPLLDSLIEAIPENRKLILMHERNRVAFQKVHHPGHAKEHEDLEERLMSVMSDPAIPLRDRVRMGCALAAVMGGLLFGGDAFSEVSPQQVVNELKSAIHDLLGQPCNAAPS